MTRSRFAVILGALLLAVLAGAASALWFNASGGTKKAAAGEVRLFHDREVVGVFTPGEAVARAEEIVGFKIIVPEKLRDVSLRLAQVRAVTTPINGQPTLTYASLVYFPGSEFEAGKPVLTIAQFPEPGLLPPAPSEDLVVVGTDSAKVYVGAGDSRSPALTFGLTVIGDSYPHFNITSQGIPLADLLEIIRGMSGSEVRSAH